MVERILADPGAFFYFTLLIVFMVVALSAMVKHDREELHRKRRIERIHGKRN